MLAKTYAAHKWLSKHLPPGGCLRVKSVKFTNICNHPMYTKYITFISFYYEIMGDQSRTEVKSSNQLCFLLSPHYLFLIYDKKCYLKFLKTGVSTKSILFTFDWAVNYKHFIEFYRWRPCQFRCTLLCLFSWKTIIAQ